MDSGIVEYDFLVNQVKAYIKEGIGPFSLVKADLDNLGLINKQYGKLMGDEVIKKAGSILLRNLSEKDLLNRNGDEFFILLAGKGSERSLMEMEEIRKHLSDNMFELVAADKTENIYITLSFGIASYPRDSKNQIELFRVADSAMFRAKKLGKNKVCLSEVESMVLKSSYFTKTQIDRLSTLSKETERTEAFLLREAVDDLFKKYSKR